MILKSYDINKIDISKNNFILFHGKNEGLKRECINQLVNNKYLIKSYEEKEIIEKEENFLESIFSHSLFDEKKIILIKRISDKILNIIEKIETRNIPDIYIILDSINLDKKSKLRSYFEKNKKCISIAIYEDSEQVLSKLAYNFFKDKRILISNANINLIVNRCNGDRENLYNELRKIEFFSKSGKKLDTETLIKLTNLAENHNVSELIDNCLAKNKSKIINILQDNNFSSEDCIIITRVFLNKSKKILKLSEQYKLNNDIELTISKAKPPIFWKDKEITKQQIYKWKPENIKKLIYNISKIELLVKKNLSNPINIVSNFILEQAS